MHCKRTSDSESEIDLAQTLNIESSHNEDHFREEIPRKSKKRRKNIKPKRCKVRDCDFVTTEGSDVTEMKKELWMHMRKNHKYPLACRLCPFVTEPKHHMVYHWLGDHTKLRPFKCEEANCSYSCVAKSMLNSHVVRHWDVHQYNCKECPFKARLLHAMKKHMREKNHSRVLILNEDGTPNETAIIDVYSKKRGPRRNTVAKIQDKSDQSDLNQSSSSTASPEPQVLDSHSEAQQQLSSIELDINKNNNQSMIHSTVLQMLHNLNDLITDTILNWKNNPNPICWTYIIYMFKSIFGENVISYINLEMINLQDRLDYMFFMQKTINFYIDNINKIDHNFEIIDNSGAGPSNDKIDVNHIDKLSMLNKLKCQPEIQNILTIGRANFETAKSGAGPLTYKKYVNQASTSNKRKAASEELDDMTMTDNYFNLTNNNANSSNKIFDEISTSEKLESQIQSDKIPNQPFSISKFKITGATKRKSKIQTRFAVEEKTERNKIESFDSPMNNEYDLQEESQINVTVNNVNLNNCKYCDLTFGNKFMYVMHMQFHTINEPYTCNACGAKCVDCLTFNSHLIYGKH